MYPFNITYATEKKSKGTNKCQGIVIHHTAGGTFRSNMNYLALGDNQASVHFVIGESEERGKIGDPKDILRHAGNGSWGDVKNVNTAFLGIEVVGYGEYNLYQLIALTDLVQYLMGTFNISKENIIRHSDCTQASEYTSKKILRDGKRSSKKKDIGLNFFPNGFEARRESLYPRTESRYGLYK